MGRRLFVLADFSLESDYLGSELCSYLPYWDRYNEGVFIGSQHAGSPLHMDQCIWSNVGKNFTGYKLIAIWKYDENIHDLIEPYHRRLFHLPGITKSELELLSQCAKIVLLHPGDVFIIGGGNPHMALCVSKSLSLTAYESFVNFNLANINAFLDSNQEPIHHEEFHMDNETLEDVKLDVADLINDNFDKIQRNKISDKKVIQCLVEASELLRKRCKFLAKNIYKPDTVARKLGLNNSDKKKRECERNRDLCRDDLHPRQIKNIHEENEKNSRDLCRDDLPPPKKVKKISEES